MKYFVLFVVCLPIFVIYIIFCFASPLIRFGRVRKGKGCVVYVVSDLIHSDYLFSSDVFPEFGVSRRYVKVGWGDRKIFLETKTWADLKLENFIRAFFGLNTTVLRVDYLDEIPKGARKIEMGLEQLESLKFHVRGSFVGSPIERRSEDYQGGIFYESSLGYNCITNCNNWVGVGLRRAGVSNRLWTPLSFW